MAFNDPFSFGSENDLLPVWNDDLYPLLNDELLPDYEFWDLGNFPPPEQNFAPSNYPTEDSLTFDQFGNDLAPVVEEQNQQFNAEECENILTNIFSIPTPPSDVVQQPINEPTQNNFQLGHYVENETHMIYDGFVSNEVGGPEESTLNYGQHMDGNSSHISMRLRKEKRRVEETEEYNDLDADSMRVDTMCIDGEDDPTDGFKLPASKSPIMEAMVVCALHGWGIDVVKNFKGTTSSPAEVVFKVTDFDRYYRISRTICSKQRPTDDLGSRVKSLRRWFVNFPKKKDRCENAPFLLVVKPHITKKVIEIIERNTRMLGLTKRRRRQ